jgi:hypothetical protein
MGEPEGLRNVAADDRSADEPGGVRATASDRGQEQRRTGREHREESVTTQRSPTASRIAREPLSKGGVDRRELRIGAGHRYDRDAQPPVETVQVQDVEPADHRPVQQHRVQALESARRFHQTDQLGRSVPPVDPHPPDAYGLHAVRSRDRDRRHRCPPVGASERPVVDPDDPDVQFGKSRTQR